MKESAYWIERLGLALHPEGGWFRETYRSAETIPAAGLPERFGGERSFCTVIQAGRARVSGCLPMGPGADANHLEC